MKLASRRRARRELRDDHTQIVLRVHGEPIPQPRERYDGRNRRTYRDSSTGIEPWRQRVHLAFRALGSERWSYAADWAAARYALQISMLFLFTKPPTSRLDEPIGVPDWDNLAKAVQDALEKAGAYKNDSRITVARVSKVWRRPDEMEGVICLVEPAIDGEAWHEFLR